MKQTNIILLTIALIALILPMVESSWYINSQGANQLFYCLNATNGALVGTTATFNCTSSPGFATSQATLAATNIQPGVFNITLSLVAGAHTCQIDCGTATAVDYFVQVFVTNYSLTTNNDKSGYSLASEQRVGLVIDAVNTSTIADNGIGAAELAANAIGSSEIATNAIDADAIDAAAITSSEAPNLDVASSLIQNDVTAVGVDVNTSLTNENNIYLDTQFLRQAIIGNLSTIYGAIVGNTSNWFISTYQTRLDTAITTRSSHSAADIDAQLNTSHSSGNWSNTASGALSNADKRDIANMTASNFVWNNSIINRDNRTINITAIVATASIAQADINNIANTTWYQNANLFCTVNSSFNVNSSGRYLCDIWKFRT